MGFVNTPRANTRECAKSRMDARAPAGPPNFGPFVLLNVSGEGVAGDRSMQTSRPFTVTVVSLAAVALSLGGCATKGFVRQQVGVEDTKLQATQTQVSSQGETLQTHETHLGELDKNTRDALERAEAAGKLAEGKFLYSMVLSDDSVKFPVDGSKLSPEAQTRLMDFVQKLKTDNKNVYLEIQGHTDSTGPEPVNKRLGEERAEAVRLFMNQQGVALNRMSTISYGDDSPVASNKTRVGRAQNRRVVVIVLA
jgi:outer membrane protein OmpA-like peptidoglycan-associated protein